MYQNEISERKVFGWPLEDTSASLQNLSFLWKFILVHYFLLHVFGIFCGRCFCRKRCLPKTGVEKAKRSEDEKDNDKKARHGVGGLLCRLFHLRKLSLKEKLNLQSRHVSISDVFKKLRRKGRDCD